MSADRPVWLMGMAAGVFLGLGTCAHADTVYLKNKGEIHGVIVEEFADRYVLKTVDGEKPVMKNLAAGVKYDDPEQSYYQLGQNFQRVGRLRDALKAYQKAVELQPGFQVANEAAFSVQRMLDRQDEPQLLAEIHQKQVVMEQSGQVFFHPSASVTAQGPNPFGTFEKRFGASLRHEGEWVVVADIQPRSPASADFRPGDRVIAVSGEPLGHLKADEVAEQLNSQENEMQLILEREVKLEHPSINSENRWGFRLESGYDGVRVTQVDRGGPAGGECQVGDLVVAVDHQPTRYMPMSQVEQLMSKGDLLVLSIRRGVFLREQGR